MPLAVSLRPAVATIHKAQACSPQGLSFRSRDRSCGDRTVSPSNSSPHLFARLLYVLFWVMDLGYSTEQPESILSYVG